MIVITTPTGRIGQHVVDEVLDGGEQVRVIVRDPSRLPRHVRERVDVVQGSHNDIDVVTEAFAGADALLWVVPPNLQARSVEGYYRDFTRPAAQAITGAGVQRVIGISSLGRDVASDSGLVSGKHALVSGVYAMDALIESTGVNYRALRMPAYMDNVLWQLEPITARGTFYGSQSGDHRTPTCATRDIAAAAAALLLDDSWSGQGSVPVLGPEDLSFDDMAQIMSEVLERSVRYEQVPRDAYMAGLIGQGMGEAYAQGLIDNQAEADRGLYNVEPRTRQSTTPTSFRQWCVEVLKPAVLA